MEMDYEDLFTGNYINHPINWLYEFFKTGRKTAPTGEIIIDVKGNDYSTLIKNTYKDVKKQCLNEEPKIITQKLLQDDKQIEIPTNPTTEKPFGKLFATTNQPVLQMQSTPKANYEYHAVLKCSGWHVNFTK